MTEVRGIEAGSWETLSLEDKVEWIKKNLDKKFPELLSGSIEPVAHTEPEEDLLNKPRRRR